MKLKLFTGLALAALGALFAVPAAAYTLGPGSGASTSASSVAGGQSFTFTATFTDATGAPISGVGVTFSQQSGPSGCTATFSPATSTTNASGQASTTVTLPAGCPGSFVLAATLNGGGTVTATVTEVAPGFPNTSASRDAIPMWAIGSILAGGLLVLVAVFGLTGPRREAFAR
jgi:Bacterial Ig-like domain (group 1)